VLLLAIAVALAMLLRRTWPVTPPGQRVARILILGGLAAIALLRLFA
jgi:hypothetical protein